MRLAATILGAILAGAACSQATAPSDLPTTTVPTATAGSPTPTASAEHPTTTATNAPTAAPPGDPIERADASCRKSTYRDAGTLTVAAVVGDLVTIVYTGAEGDFLCQYLPAYGDTAVVQGGFTHFADQVTADAPMVLDSNQSWTSDTGTYVWGAVGPAVASVVVEVAPSVRIDAQVAGGYVLAVIGPGVPCCVFTVVALDADGRELARRE